MNRLVNLIFLLLYCSLIYWLSSRPSIPTPMLFEHQDKIHHMGAYFIMGLLASRFFNDFFEKKAMWFIASLSFCSLYGMSDEWHQSFVQGRNSDFFDWIADTFGALLALSALSLVKQRIKTERQTD